MVQYRVDRRDVVCIVDSRDMIGEGAFWCGEEQALYWLDVPMPAALHRFIPATGQHDKLSMPEMISAMAKRKDGSLLVASQNGVNFLDFRDGRLRRQISPEADQPRNRSNDGAPDARGRFWMGTMMNNIGPNGEALPITEAGAVWRINPDLSYEKAISGLTITNGIVWSPDQKTMYVADSATQIIHAFDFDLDAGKATARRAFSTIKDLGYPDGAAVDSDGFLWSARWEGQCVARFAPGGTVDRIVPIPAPRVTSCAFGGKDLKTLYVTTARYEATAEQEKLYPQQGSIFAFEAPAPGLLRPQFAG